MTGGRGPWAAWLAWTVVLGLWSLRAQGAAGLAVAVTGTLFAGVAVAAVGSRPRFAALAGAAAAAWFVADLWPGLLWVHRPLMAAAALSFASGRIVRASSRVVLVALALGSVIPWAATSPQVTLVLSAGLAVCAWQEHRSARLDVSGQGREARTRAGATTALAAALAVPAGVRWLDPFTVDVVMAPVIGPALEVIYCVLIAVAAVIMMVALLGGVEQSAADAAVQVPRGGDAVVLERLRGQAMTSSAGRGRSGRGQPEGRALDGAIELLERRLALQEELSDTVDAVRASRRRLVAATEVERMRLRRRLAERVMPLIPELDSILARVAGSSSGELVGQCRDEVTAIGVGLDRLANGLHPAGLTADGLKDLRTAFAGAPIPVVVGVPPGRLPPEVEAAGWYACTETVTNAVKHSGATRVTVELAVANGALVGSVVDDGVGGAQVDQGGGLAGLRDRLEALGGRLAVDSPDAGGTTIRFEVPAR